MNNITLNRPWLEFDLGTEMQVLSWSINRPGIVMARRILWREVRNADLPEGLDVGDWLDAELIAHKATDAVAFLTSANVTRYATATATAGRCTAQCVATVGLSNAERVGQRIPRAAGKWGTINIALRLDCGLAQSALIEALSIATQARTAAIIDADIPLPTGRATGTGTDCIAVAAPPGPTLYAGLHTDIGEALGAAVYRATQTGAQNWKAEMAALMAAPKARQ
ncbi:adenosylcobinamide amidohydrolase (plasmid) [Pseudorhodobacter turbinis]|uniref:Adenosylcobinamide amidohydrolase n=1 Tax=Pseudorhodobacter turbinis TaxID=2500533 RepID=A0A4P8EL04_9RHOB|nr:adenosylcobinamide amidohydrolase [Pseudorhodobacter turbinis]QCO57643.1 adenosylcobinamide amidohydrolase [Pseudorhodobacter turbinis]